MKISKPARIFVPWMMIIALSCSRSDRQNYISLPPDNIEFASLDDIRKYLYSVIESETDPDIILRAALIANEYQDLKLTADCLEKYYAGGGYESAALFLKGSVALSRKDFRGAIIDLKKSISAGQDNYEHYNLLAKAYTGIHQPDSSMWALEMSLLQFPGNAETCFMAGNTSLELGDSVKGIAFLENAVRLNPGIEDAADQIIGLYRKKGDLNKAILFITEQLLIQPDDVSLKSPLAEIYITLKKYREADSLIGTIPDEGKILSKYLLLGKLNFARSRYDSSIYFADKILAAEKRNTEALLLMGKSMDRAGQFYDALETFDRIRSIDSTNAVALREINNLKRKIAYLRKINEEQDEPRPQIEPLDPLKLSNQIMHE